MGVGPFCRGTGLACGIQNDVTSTRTAASRQQTADRLGPWQSWRRGAYSARLKEPGNGGVCVAGGKPQGAGTREPMMEVVMVMVVVVVQVVAAVAIRRYFVSLNLLCRKRSSG